MPAQESVSEVKKSRVVYIDALRTLAAFAVVLLHGSASFVGSGLPFNSEIWLTANFLDSLSRWSVPVFVMASGVFMLDPDRPVSISSIWRKNIPRLAIVYVAWSALYALLGVAANGWSGFVQFASSIVQGCYHMWFLPMLIMLYILTPALRPIVRNKSLAKYCTVLFLVFPVFVTYVTLLPPEISSPFQGLLNSASVSFGYVGYYLLGYMLSKFCSTKQQSIVIYLVGVFGAVVTICGTYYLSESSQVLNIVLYGNSTANVLVMAIAMFVWLKNASSYFDRHDLLATVLTKFASVGLGVYLVHVLVLELTCSAAADLIATYPALMLVWTLFVFLTSCGIAYVLKRIPFIPKWLV